MNSGPSEPLVGRSVGDPHVSVTPGTAEGTWEFEWRGRTGPFTVLLGPGVFTPTHTSMVLADALDLRVDDVVIDVGCGCGVLGMVAARLGAGRVFGCDISPEAIGVAKLNAHRLGVEDRTEFWVGHLFDPIQGVQADVVIGDVSGVPDGLAELTGWFPGGPTGAELPVAMLDALGPCLRPGGCLYLPTATFQSREVLETARRLFHPEHVELVATRKFPLPTSVAGSPVVAELAAKGFANLERRGTRLLWELSIWRCRRPF